MAIETCASKQGRLTELDAAILKLASGGQEILIRSGDKTVQYGVGNLGYLRQLRDELADQVACCTGDNVRRRRILYMMPVG